MGQIQRLTRGQAKPYASIPRIDWAHPLAQKLAVYCYDIGGNYVDLVNGGQSKLTSTSGRANSKFGLGVSFPSATSFGSMPQNANATAVGQTAPFSVAIATFYPGALGALDGSLVCTGEVANTANTAIAFTTNNPASNMGAIYNNGTTNVHYNQAISVGAFQSWGYTAKSSSAGDLYANGALDQSISGITTTLAVGASQVMFNSAQANTQAFGGGLNGFLPYFAVWNNRVLTAADYRQLHDDPYCFLIYPEDEMFATLKGGTTTAYTLPNSAGSFTISGQAGALNKALKEANATGAFVISGQAGTLSAGRKLAGVSGAFVISGKAATELRGIKLPNSAGAFVINGQAATLTLTTAGHFTLAGDAGVFTISGQAGALSATRKLAGVSGSFVISGQAAGMLRGIKLPNNTPGAFVISGQNATELRGIKLPNSAGAFVISGQAGTLGHGLHMAGVAGAFVISGQSAAFPVALSMKGAEGVFVIGGPGAVLTYTPAGGGPPPEHSNPFFAVPGRMTSLP